MKQYKCLYTAVAGVLLATGAGCQPSHGNAHADGAGEIRSESARSGTSLVRVAGAALRYIRTVEIEPSQVRNTVHGPGRVDFAEGAVADISVPVPGRITHLHAKVGETVSPGAPLITLDSPTAAQLRAEYNMMKARLSVARESVARQRRLLEQGIGVEMERLAAETSLVEAESAFAQAGKAVAFLGSGSGSEVVVRSAIGGTVLARDVMVGAFVDPAGGPAMKVGDPARLRVVVDLFERDVAHVQAGAPAKIEVTSVGAVIHGTVTAVGGAVLTASRRVPVFISIDTIDAPVRSGMYVKAEIQSAPAAGFLLPATAVLIKDGGRQMVYVETAPGEFSPRPVEVGPVYNGKVRILKGLSDGDRVAVEGALLIDGASTQLL